MLLVVGLGNPGREYASHRHNVGFMAVDELARRVNADAFRDKFSGRLARGTIGGEPALLLEPQTYMNDSGRSVQAAMAFHKVAPSELVVIHDELDLPFGAVRLKVGGGHAGHNGLRSIIACVGTGDFARLRFGIGRPPPGFRGEVADFVLSGFDGAEAANLADPLKTAVETVLDVAARGVAAAMNTRNAREKQPEKKQRPKAEGEVAGDAGPGEVGVASDPEPRDRRSRPTTPKP